MPRNTGTTATPAQGVRERIRFTRTGRVATGQTAPVDLADFARYNAINDELDALELDDVEPPAPFDPLEDARQRHNAALDQIRQAQQAEQINLYARALNTDPWQPYRMTWGAAGAATAVGTRIPMAEEMPPPAEPGTFVNTFRVGCDPEFVVLDGAHLKNVNAILPHEGEVGSDHNGSCVELRPKAWRSSYQVVQYMRLLMTGPILKPLLNYRWRAGGCVRTPERTLTLGGHVHLDVLPPEFAGREFELAENRIRALDRFTRHLEQLDILPTQECAERRAEGDKNWNMQAKYGRWGDIRAQRNGLGGTYRTEYRTMASWLFDPRVAMICLTGAKLAACAPQVVFDALRPRAVSLKNLVNLFEFYRHKDDDAKRVLEKFVDGGVALRAQPDADLKEVWRDLPF